jgi:hypothetical protein
MYQVTTIPDYGNDRLTALHELQNTAHWFNVDGQKAKSATGGSELVLTLPDDSTISYSLSGTELFVQLTELLAFDEESGEWRYWQKFTR